MQVLTQSLWLPCSDKCCSTSQPKSRSQVDNEAALQQQMLSLLHKERSRIQLLISSSNMLTTAVNLLSIQNSIGQAKGGWATAEAHLATPCLLQLLLGQWPAHIAPGSAFQARSVRLSLS